MILQTKILLPQLREPFVARPRLCAQLDSVLQRRLGLVCAPAGYGKTTLLGEWLRSLPAPEAGGKRLHVAWLTLEKAWDADNVFHPRVVNTPEGYVMVYSSAPRLNRSSTLGYALSDDGVSWQRAAQPILDYSAVAGGRAIWFSALEYVEGAYYVFFELGTGGETEVYLAVSEGLGGH